MFNLKKTVSSIADVGKNLFKKEDIKQNDIGSIIDLCDDLISNKGAAFGIALARDITDSYESLSLENKLSFLKKINEKFKPNHAKLNEAINAYKILQYELENIEKNHEDYVNNKKIIYSKKINKFIS